MLKENDIFHFKKSIIIDSLWKKSRKKTKKVNYWFTNVSWDKTIRSLFHATLAGTILEKNRQNMPGRGQKGIKLSWQVSFAVSFRTLLIFYGTCIYSWETPKWRACVTFRFRCPAGGRYAKIKLLNLIQTSAEPFYVKRCIE